MLARRVIWFSLYAATLPAASNQDCASCHAAEVKAHDRTRMAHAMVPAINSAFAENIPERPLRESSDGYEYHLMRRREDVSITASRATDQAQGVIEWIMGSGAQGQTPIVYAQNGRLESRISYFPALRQYGITVGQNGGTSVNAQAALGVRQSPRDLQMCLSCHATAITQDLQPVTPGIQCERCHHGAEQHARGEGRPVNPGKMVATEQVRFCGSCHRTKPLGGENDLENVRFQPYRLMKSACFASGGLACTTCHAAHQDAVRNDPGSYNAKCGGCHNKDSGTPFHADERRSGDCIGCHMPYVQIHPALKFTDHYIRVVKSGDLPASAVLRRGAGS